MVEEDQDGKGRRSLKWRKRSIYFDEEDSPAKKNRRRYYLDEEAPETEEEGDLDEEALRARGRREYLDEENY